MRFRELRVEGFRNLEPLRLTLHPWVNWISGANGQGKSNFLEALAYLLTGRSPRRARDEELIRFDGEHFFLGAELEDDGGGALRLSASCERGGRRRIRLDEKEIDRLSELIGLTGMVQFGPGDVELVAGEPETRRRYLDYTLSKSDPAYLAELLAYRRIVMQRNALLRAGRAGPQLAVWSGRLAEHGARLILARRENLPELAAAADALYAALSGDGERLSLAYRGCVEGSGEQELREALEFRLASLERAESLKKNTLSGPHRDDMRVDIGGRDARKFASQGQKRSAAVALKLAQAEYLARVRRDRPILILDDVFSELDADRRERLCRLIGRYQTFIATPRAADLREDLFGDIARFRIAAGRITLW